MLRNHLTVARRNLVRNKTYSLISLSGLVIGMACFLLALLYVQYEYAWDRHHPFADRTYRVIRETSDRDGTTRFTEWVSGPLGPAMREEFPEVQRAIRVDFAGVRVASGGRSFRQIHTYSDPGVLEVFALPLVRGDRETVFRVPLSMAITEDMAQLFFGNDDPMGKVLSISHARRRGDYTVTGVLKNPPASSDLRFHCLTTTVGGPEAEYRETVWAGHGLSRTQTFVVLPEGYDPSRLERGLSDLIELMAGHVVTEAAASDTYHLQPLTRMHLFSEEEYGIRASGDTRQVTVVALVAFGVLLIACANFVNLTTARSLTRVREVGIRKVVGAHRGQLMRQFVGESVMLAGLALLLALWLVGLALPAFNAHVGRSLSLTGLFSLPAILGTIGVLVLVGGISGGYPAYYLSTFQPAAATEGTRGPSGRSWFRRGLVVIQFAISVVLMVGMLVIDSQLTYVNNKDLGYNREHLVLIGIFRPSQRTNTDPSTRLSARYEVVKQVFRQHPDILKTTAFRFTPGKGYGGGRPRTVRSEDGETWRMYVNEVDADFLDVFEIRLVAGRGFSKAIPSDATDAVLINETARDMLGWGDPLGKRLKVLESTMQGTIVGVVGDFHIQTLRDPIVPLVLHMRSALFWTLGLRVQGDHLPDVIPFLEAQWNRFVPGQPFQYSLTLHRIGGRMCACTQAAF